MAHYRIYLLNQKGGIDNGIDANCDDDKAVKELAQRLLTGNGRAEIWSGDRSLGQVSAASAQDIIEQSEDWIKSQL